MKTKQVRQYLAIVALISVGISILVHFNSILGQIVPASGNFAARRNNETLPGVISEVFVTFLVAFCLFMLNYYILKPINSSRRLKLTTILFAILMTIVAVTVLSDGFFTIKRLLSADSVPKRFNLLYTFRDLFMAIVVMCSVLVIRIIYEKQAILLENEKLIRENLQSQFESLKNRLSPHFLFNSLTALKALISDDPKIAKLYLNDLSQVLRYTLQSNENQTVSLSDEIEAAKSYIFLIKMRFDANLKIEFNISTLYNHYRLPPLAIQTLIENAVKHNEISKRSPLILSIATSDNNSLVVTNSIQEKISLEPGTGIGLSNLSKQYKLLSGQDIRISKFNNEFRVEVPLLKPNTDESSNR